MRSKPLGKLITAHVIIPFLRALDWPQELIAVDWRRMDMALFDRLRHTQGV